MAGHNGDVYALCAHGTTLVSGGLDGTVRVWNAVTGRCEKIFTGHKVGIVHSKSGGISAAPTNAVGHGGAFRYFQDSVTCVAMDDQYIFSGSMDKTVRGTSCDQHQV